MPGNVQYFMSDYLELVRLRAPIYDRPASFVNPEEASALATSAYRMLQDVAVGLVQTEEVVEQEWLVKDQLEYGGAYNIRFHTNGYA